MTQELINLAAKGDLTRVKELISQADARLDDLGTYPVDPYSTFAYKSEIEVTALSIASFFGHRVLPHIQPKLAMR